MSELVYVVDESTGQLRPDPVPRWWLDHPVIGARIRLYGEQSPSAVDKPVAGTHTPATGGPVKGKI